MTHAVIRVRGDISVRSDISDTMKLLRLNKINHCVLIQEDEVTKGMLRKVKDYVTWGEINTETLTQLIIQRGRLSGKRAITPEFIKENTEYKSVADLAKAVAEEKIRFSGINGVKPVFRLHPPIKGYEGIKRSYKAGGALGYRGEVINDLIRKMLGPVDKPEPKKKAPAKKKVAKVAKAAKKAPKKKSVEKPEPKEDKADEKKPSAPRKKKKKVKKVASSAGKKPSEDKKEDD